MTIVQPILLNENIFIYCEVLHNNTNEDVEKNKSEIKSVSLTIKVIESLCRLKTNQI